MDRLTFADWRDWTRITGVCRDADEIPRVADAGKIVVENGSEIQIMHNGLRILKNGYAMGNIANLIWMMKGIHEPQEEKCFHEVLKYVRRGGVMIELGSNWAYYSMWFYKMVDDAVCHCIEIDQKFIELGIRHFDMNGVRGIFTNAAFGNPNLHPWRTERVGNYIRALPNGQIFGDRPLPTAGFHRNIPIITLDQYITDSDIQEIDILHSDIQGDEGRMLEGATVAFENKKVKYVFISTHGDPVHAECIDRLRRYDYRIVAEHSIADSFAGDGLVVAKSPDAPGPDEIPISKRTQVCAI